MPEKITLAEKIVAIQSATDLVKSHSLILKQIRETDESFTCSIGGRTYSHTHPELTAAARDGWVEGLKELAKKLEDEIMECSIETLTLPHKAHLGR